MNQITHQPEMRWDVCLANKDAILAELDGYLNHAQLLREIIAISDSNSLLEQFKQASEIRLAWGQNN